MADYILTAARQGLALAVVVSAPALLAAVTVGLLLAIVQAATQIQEQTLSFVAKLVAVAVVLAVTASWVGGQMARFCTILWAAIPMVGR